MRVHHVKAARKSKKSRRCRCGHKIQPGEPYKWAEPRYGPFKFWCKDHTPRRSELTSAKIGPVYDAQDDFDVSTCTTVEDLESALSDVRQTAEEVKGEYEEGLENMPEGLRESSPVGEQSQEMVDNLEEWIDKLESVEFDPEDDDIEDNRTLATDVVNELEA